MSDNKRIEINVKMSVTPSQAIALESMFETWNSLADMGSSRNVSFFVDGDGNFKPNCYFTSYNRPKELALPDDVIEYLKKKAYVNDKSGDFFFDYDSVAWAMRYHRNKSFCLSEKDFRSVMNDKTLNLRDGYYKGNYEEGICRFPSLMYGSSGVPFIGVSFKSPYLFRNEEGEPLASIPIWCRVVVDGKNSWITVHKQIFDITEGGFCPWDWEMEKHIPEDKFI